LARKTVLKIPDSLTYEEATMMEPAACSVRSLSQCGISFGDRLLVIGDGPMGLLLSILAKYFGASLVIMGGHHDFRVRTAEKLGVNYAYNSHKVNMGDKVKYLTDGRGVDIVIVAVASTTVVQEALKMARRGGKICLFGDFRDVAQPPVKVAPDLMISQDKNLFGSWGCSPRDYQTALNMIKIGRVPARELITHTFPMERFREALDLMEKKGECLRVVIQL
jgi:L-iditol 2-dehydrogenase